MRRLLVAMVAALILTLASAASISAEAGLDSGTNAKRSAHGLAPLATSSTLTSLAAQRAAQVAARDAAEGWGLWLHEFWWWDASGCSGIGENLAYYGAYDTGWVTEAWYNSPSHRSNMLGNFDVQGSATFTRSDGVIFFVQLYGNDCGGSAPAPAPAAPQTVSVAPSAPRTGSAPAPVVRTLPDTAMPIEP